MKKPMTYGALCVRVRKWVKGYDQQISTTDMALIINTAYRQMIDAAVMATFPPADPHDEWRL